MPGDRSIAGAEIRLDRRAGRLLLASALAVVGALAGLIMVQLPGALALPAFSTLLVLSGLGLAAASHFKGLRMEHGGTDSYTIAGLLVFLGFAIALLTDAEQTLVFFDEMETQGLANFSK